MADPILWTKVLKILKMIFLFEIDYSDIFLVTDYEIAVIIEKFLIVRRRIQDGGSQIMGKNTKNAKNVSLTRN